MSILVHCTCSKQLRVPEEYLGKKVRCPSCGEPRLVVSEGAGTPKPPVAPDEPTTPAGTPAVLRFQCQECSRPMQARLEYAGRKVRCPSCQSAVSVPDTEEEIIDGEEVEEEEVSRAKASIRLGKPLPGNAPRKTDEASKEAPASEEETDKPEADDPDVKKKPRKLVKAGGSALGLLVSLAAAAVLLVTGGVLAAMFLLKGRLLAFDDLSLIPNDAQVFMIVRVADLWNNPGVQQAIGPIQQQVGMNFVTKMEDSFGVAPGDVERISLVGQDLKNQKGWLIVRTSKPYDKVKTIEKLELQPDSKTHRGKKYQLHKDGKGAVHFASDRVVLLAADEESLQLALDTASGHRKAEPGKLKPALDLIRQNQHVLIGFTVPDDVIQMARQQVAALPLKINIGPLLDIQCGSIVGNLDGNKAETRITLTYPDEDKATTVKGLFATLKFAAGFALGQLPPAQAAEMKKALDELSITSEGSDVLIKSSGEFKPEEVVRNFNNGFQAGQAWGMGVRQVGPPNLPPMGRNPNLRPNRGNRN